MTVEFLKSSLNLSLKTLCVNGVKTVLLGLSLVALTGCETMNLGDRSDSEYTGKASKRLAKDAQYYTDDFPEVSENTLAINAEQDRFRVGDIADIYVYNVESLTNTYPIDREGNISFPLIGTQKVAGLTTLELQKELMVQYGATYLQNPSITVKIEASKLGKIVVDGAVKKPGVFELYNTIRLSEAIAMAEGLTANANSKEVFLVREIEGKRHVKPINLKEIRRLGAADPTIYPDDIVFVQDSSGRMAYNEFLRTVPLLSALLIAGTR